MSRVRWACLALLLLVRPEAGQGATVADLVRAYPDVLTGTDGSNLIWRDGTRMPLGELHPGRLPDDPGPASLRDQLAASYPAGAPLLAPDADPGRLRNQAFFDKLYGDCRVGAVEPRLARIMWLPKTWGHAITFTSIGGAARSLEAISHELDELPPPDQRFLHPLGGTYKCRSIAGTDQTSMHSWAAAIDLNTAFSDYWRWARRAGDPPPYRNRIPADIVDIFERHGFIWGGRWAHFDTMHFEYRPELLPARAED